MSLISLKVSSILKSYSSDEGYQDLKNARGEYFKLTGTCDSDSPEYEAKMNSFNDWYVFNYKKNSGESVYVRYFNNNEEELGLLESFHNVNYSVFKVIKINDKRVELFDILHDERLIVLNKDALVQFVAEDVFVGRIISYKNKNYMLKGVCNLPQESFSHINKICKRLRKLRAYNKETDLLLFLEQLKMRLLHYSHLDLAQIFNFSGFKLK